MKNCACGELLLGQKKMCDDCKENHNMKHKKELRSTQFSSPWQRSIYHIAKPKRCMLQEPISDDRQREIDEEIDKIDERRFNLNPLDPRAISIIRPAIWLWQ
jgi:hypothetical protein